MAHKWNWPDNVDPKEVLPAIAELEVKLRALRRKKDGKFFEDVREAHRDLECAYYGGSYFSPPVDSPLRGDANVQNGDPLDDLHCLMLDAALELDDIERAMLVIERARRQISELEAYFVHMRENSSFYSGS